MQGVTGTAICAHLDCSRETLYSYLANNVIVKLPNDRYDQDDCRKRVLKYLRSRSAGRTGSSDANLSTERAALTREQTLAAQIKNATARGDLVSLLDIQRLLIALFAVFRERLLTIPGKMADPLSMRTREEIEPLLRDELYEALDELSDPTVGLGPDGDRADDQASGEGSQATS